VATLVGVSAGLGTRPATHPLFKLPDGRFPRAPQGRQIDRTVRVAAGTLYLKISEPRIQRVTNRRGGLCRATVALSMR
jgi:hypothetical protein